MIWADMLSPEEQIKVMMVETDPYKQVENEIRFCELRERRMLHRINEIMGGWDESSVVSKSETYRKPIGEKPVFDDTGTLEFTKVFTTVAVEVERTVKTSQKLERVLAIEEALTRVQDKKANWIDLLCKIEARELNEEEQRLRIQKLGSEVAAMKDKVW